MRKYKNEIDEKIIKIAFTDEELLEFKEIARAYEEIKRVKQDTEREMKEKLKGFVIGELQGINLRYSEYDKSLLIQYKDDYEQKSETLSDKIKGYFK